VARRAGEGALDLCLSCKGCKADCPVNVDMATANRNQRTQWITAICDIGQHQVLDVMEGRQRPELSEWLLKRPEA